MRSVLQSGIASGTTMPLWVRNGSILGPPLPDVDEMAGDRRGRGHRRTHEVRAASGALPALEIPVGGRRAPLAGTENVRVHPEAHRAAGFAPLEARLREDA